jgi:hypothetical protein
VSVKIEVKLSKFNYFFISVALLASVIIWLQDFNSNGVLNMTPSEREELTKSALSPLTTSINDDVAEDSVVDNGAGQAREVRNKYLSRIGVQDTGNSSDTEPLLQ